MAKTASRRNAASGELSSVDILSRIERLARDLWWTWNPDGQRLLAALDPVLWAATNHNPIATLAGLTETRRAGLGADDAFLALLRACERQHAEYLKPRTWFQRTARGARKRLRVAYFCAEFGLHESLPQYAGGLGVLAGDHLKSASDLGIPLVGVGLLYRNGYYRQELRGDGSTRVVYPQLDFTQLPISDTGKLVAVPIGRRSVLVKVWRVQVGRVPLYLLDADHAKNARRDRAITQHLYGGDSETRIQQEILLGVGGVRALAALEVRANVFHLNEGHAAFAVLERLRTLRAAGLSYARALALVRQSTVFTTHTPVPAGHDRFPPALIQKYLGVLGAELGLGRNEFLGLGREKPRDRREPFCMTVLALKGSARCNGVSQLHGEVSRAMWTGVFGAARPAYVPITHVTNGIHAETWLAPEMRPLYGKYLKPRWVGAGPDDDWWRRAGRIPADELWHARNLLRRKLVQFVRGRLRQQIERRCEPLSELIAALEALDENALTIGFARRFATYKRAPLILRDPRRLARILGDARRPVQIVFAGKAHPADRDGQRLVQQVCQQASRAGLRGRVVLLEDYDMHVGRMLTAGCDVWLNNPIRPQEASGTSGMKPALHGGLNCSILDGWWPEAYNGRNGWAIDAGASATAAPTMAERGATAVSAVRHRLRLRQQSSAPHERAATRDRHTAEAIYSLLEDKIVPLFYDRDRRGVPQRWVRYMINSMQSICGQFNTHRMLAEYLELYAPKAD